MDKHHLQHAFDRTVEVLLEGTILEGDISILTKVKQLDALIESLPEVKEALVKIKKICQANAIPDDFLVRTKEYAPIVKNSTTRSDGKPFTEKTPRRRKQKSKKRKAEIGVLVMRSLKRRANGATLPELADALNEGRNSVNYALNRLIEKKKVRRRKLNKSEQPNPTTLYAYEVV